MALGGLGRHPALHRAAIANALYHIGLTALTDLTLHECKQERRGSLERISLWLSNDVVANWVTVNYDVRVWRGLDFVGKKKSTNKLEATMQFLNLPCDN